MPSNTTHPERREVLDGVIEVVALQMGLEPEKIGERDSLAEDLNCDSLDLVEILMNLEEQFDISVPDQFGEDLKTIGQVTDGMMRLLGQTRSP